MSSPKRSWARMVRGFQREYPYQVRLKYPHGWRRAHVEHALRHLRSLHDYRWWTEGNDIADTSLCVWGFKSEAEGIAFGTWTETCGIDWALRSDKQKDRPPPPPEVHAGPGPAVERMRKK